MISNNLKVVYILKGISLKNCVSYIMQSVY